MKKILLACTVPSLDGYSIGIISALINSEAVECYACIFLDGTDQRTIEQQMFRYGISATQSHRVQFHHLAANKMIRIRSGKAYLRIVRDFAIKSHIDTIHFISQDVMLYGHLSMFKTFQLYYTVHDLVPHPVKLSRFQQFKHYYFRIRKDKKLIKHVQNLITNSEHQLQQLRKLYPEKKIQMHQMPSNVTPEIKAGGKCVAETADWKDYVLFFGRIELYKGLEVLYDQFIHHPDLADMKLIIAGRGAIYFDRNRAKEQNIMFINRFIAEEEIQHLFNHAACSVLPYSSATQSAVMSLSYHHNIPVIASNIEGLRETVIPEETGLLYDQKIPNALSDAILKLMRDQILRKQIIQKLEGGQPFFDEKHLAQELVNIYQDRKT